MLEHGHLEDPDLVARVEACRQLVWQTCTEAVRRAPAAERDVPGEDDLAAAHRALSRTATAMAQTAQAVVMAAGSGPGAGGGAAAGRAVRTAAAHAQAAAAALDVPS